MDATTRAAYDANRDLTGKPFCAVCYAPFTSLLLNTLGDAVSCCRSQNYVLGNVARDSLDQIWHGARLRAMRKAMLDYRFGPGCEFCEWLIQAGDHSGAMARHFDSMTVESQTPAYPKVIEFVLGNECNFACIQCSGLWSSRIRLQREGMPALPKVYDDRFFTDLRRYLPHLTGAKFYGGEPFLTPEIHRVWDMLIEMKLRPTSTIITNGSIWNARVERVLEQLEPSMFVSLDAIADRDLLERIRVGSRYDVVTGNIQRFREWSRAHGRRLSLAFSLLRQNWTELGPMLLYAEANDFDIEIIRVAYPTEFSLFSLPQAELLRVADELDAQADTVRPHLQRLRGHWDGVVQSLRENAKASHRAEYDHVHKVNAALARNALSRMNEVFSSGDWRGTLALADTVPSTDRDYLHALCLLAHAHRRLGDLAGAERVLDEAAALSTRHSATYVERAWLRIEQGRHADALAEAQQVLKVARDDANGRLHRGYALHALAHALAHLQQSDATATAVAQWCDHAGNDVDVQRLASTYLTMVGQHAAAAERARQAEALGTAQQTA